VAEQQDRLRGPAREIHLEMIAEFLGSMKTDFTTESGKFLGDSSSDAIDSRFVIAGRFDLDEAANGRDNVVAALAEICETTLRFDVRRDGLPSKSGIHVWKSLRSLETYGNIRLAYSYRYHSRERETTRVPCQSPTESSTLRLLPSCSFYLLFNFA
jgi:hypothetical protein